MGNHHDDSDEELSRSGVGQAHVLESRAAAAGISPVEAAHRLVRTKVLLT